jgi:tetratricopeptide (TPR) repeat protein
MIIPSLVLSIALAAQTAPSSVPAAQAAPASADAVGAAYLLFIQGRALDGRNDSAGAMAAYRKALAGLPESAELHAELAGVLGRSGKLNEAVAEAMEAVKIEPSNREANRTLGLVQAQVADSSADTTRAATLALDAIGRLELALADRIVDPGAQFALGRMYVLAGQYPKGIETLRIFLLDQPGYPDAIVLLAEAYDAAHQTDDAITLLEESTTDMPRVSMMQDELGDLYFQVKRYRDAAGAFDRALVGDRTGIDVAMVTTKRDRAKALAGRVISS